MSAGGPRVDLGRLARETDLAGTLARLASLHGARIAVADAAGSVLASFGGPEGEALPARIADLPRAAVRDVVVYEVGCGSVAAIGSHRGGDAGCADVAAGLLSAAAVREYEMESLSKSLLELFEEVNLFYGITARLHAVSSADAICGTILDRACEIVRAARASILLEDPRTGILRVVASRGMSAEQAASIRVRAGEGVTGRVMETGQAVLVDDVRSGVRGGPAGDDRYASRSFISVPLKVFDPSGADEAVARMKPLGVLNMTDKEGAAVFTSGDLKLLSALASQAAVLLENTRLSGIEKEMGIARRIQASLLPERPPAIPGAEVAGVCVPARNVGGDYYDAFALPDGRLGMLIADVSGHNVGAALMMAVSRAALRAVIRENHSPRAVLAEVNSLLADDLARAELFVSVFYAVYDPATGDLLYANAGHNLPLLLRHGGDGIETLDAEGILLGVVDTFPFEERTVRLAPGDVLLIYTDGFTEAARGPGEEMFGERRLEDALRAVRDRPVAEIARDLLRAVEAFSTGADADDRTAVVMRAVTMPTAGGAAPATPD